MDSSFLIWSWPSVINIGLSFYSVILFLKLVIQFGLSNHPARFTAYVVSLCATVYFALHVAVDLQILSPLLWLKWKTLPLVCGSLGLLFQAIMTAGQFSIIQQKVISRLPLIAGLLCFAFFPTKAEFFFALSILAGSIFLTVSLGKSPYQARAFLKMSFFLLLIYGLKWVNQYWAFVLGEFLLFFGLFYFYLFEHTFGITALIDKLDPQTEGPTR